MSPRQGAAAAATAATATAATATAATATAATTAAAGAAATAAAAYSAGAAAWRDGPMRVYGRLAELLVARSPVPLAGRRVLDLGAGTGAVSTAVAAAARTAEVVAVDAALGMVLEARSARPPAAVADALNLPFPDGSFDLVVAGFSLNHLPDPAAGIREAGRAASRYVLASTYADDDDHPVKEAVEETLADAGWAPPGWYVQTKAAMASWGTVKAATDAVVRGGLEPVAVDHLRVAFPELGRADLVRWRLGMAHCAGFVAENDAGALVRRSLDRLPADAPPLVRSVIFVTARVC